MNIEAKTLSAVSRQVRVAVVALIPVVWFVAMAGSRGGDATTIMAISSILLCTAVAAVRGIDPALLRPTTKTVTIGLAAAAVMIAGTHAGFAVITRLLPQLKAQTAALYGHLSDGRSTAVAVPLVAVVVIVEEILWRGAFQSLVQTHARGPIWTVLLSSIAYAAALISFGSPLLVAIGFSCGLFWASLRGWTGSVIPPLLAHVVWDVALALFPLPMG